jgi:catechol 2,3-dioxygenase-like lactoylglutathione lyase family enzyme
MLLSLGHVTVRSADFARSERFYCDLLGLRIGPRPAIAVDGRWFYVGDEAVVHVLPRRAGAPYANESAVDHFAFNADDPGAFEDRLRAAGQPFEGRPLADTGIWQIFLTDPDGVRVELSFAAPRPLAPADRERRDA